jgi:hypothetical protein
MLALPQLKCAPLAMDMKTMQMLIAPGEQDLQDRMQVCQAGLAVHQHSTPDERADTTQDDTELVDAEQWSSGSHALRVAQRSVPLKGSPRYLALSNTVPSIALLLQGGG